MNPEPHKIAFCAENVPVRMKSELEEDLRLKIGDIDRLHLVTLVAGVIFACDRRLLTVDERMDWAVEHAGSIVKRVCDHLEEEAARGT